MNSIRSELAGALFTNDTFWVTGGENPQTEQDLSSTELYQGIGCNESSDMPVTLRDHVMARINDTHMFVFCGRDTSSNIIFNSFCDVHKFFNDLDSVWIYDRTRGDFGWTTTPLMPTSRSLCTGGVVRYPDSSLHLVVTSGSTDLTTDIYSLSYEVNSKYTLHRPNTGFA